MKEEKAYGHIDDNKTIAEIEKEHGEVVAIMGWDGEKKDSYVLINRQSVLKGRLSELPESGLDSFRDGLMRIGYIYLNKLLNT